MANCGMTRTASRWQHSGEGNTGLLGSVTQNLFRAIHGQHVHVTSTALAPSGGET
jgi:hypothetical protein